MMCTCASVEYSCAFSFFTFLYSRGNGVTTGVLIDDTG